MTKITAPKMVYIKGEEMTTYAMNLIVEQWIKPNIDISNWEFYDLSCKSRDDTKDQVLKDVIEAGKKIRSIFKEPTISPTQDQATEMGLSKAWGSPNGTMRRGWNGISISRDTIHPDGVEVGYKNKILFDREAVGGEYNAQFAPVERAGTAVTTIHPADGSTPYEVIRREIGDNEVLVEYTNLINNAEPLAHHFFKRSLEAKVTPHVVTKKTVFKFQEAFWGVMKKVFDEHYKADFLNAGLLESTRGELSHVISDAACMKLVAWKDGGYSFVSHNYDGDMLTDLMSQIQRSPAFITSVLTGVTDDGLEIKEFEASHGTVSDMYKRHLDGIETSMNPLGLVEALTSAMNFAAKLESEEKEIEIKEFTGRILSAMYSLMKEGKGTRDVSGESGLSTENFVAAVAEKI